MQLPSTGQSLDVAGGIIVLVTLVVAIAIVLVTFKTARYPSEANVNKPTPYDLGSTMGSAQWDFTKSWASTLTVVGALLGTLLSVLSKIPAQYILLNLLFLLLAVLAPLVYSFIGRMEPVAPSQDQYEIRIQQDVAKIAEQFSTIARGFPKKNQQDLLNVMAQTQLNVPELVQALLGPDQPAQANQNKAYQYQGYIGGFLAACTLTLWAVMGEVVALTFLLGNLMPGDIFLIIIQALFLLSVFVVGYYGWKTIPFTLQAQASHPKVWEEGQRNHLMRVYGMAYQDATDTVNRSLKPAQPSWSLL